MSGNVAELAVSPNKRKKACQFILQQDVEPHLHFCPCLFERKAPKANNWLPACDRAIHN